MRGFLFNPQSCHFDGGEIFASSSATVRAQRTKISPYVEMTSFIEFCCFTGSASRLCITLRS